VEGGLVVVSGGAKGEEVLVKVVSTTRSG
jgi:hypothetical protein